MTPESPDGINLRPAAPPATRVSKRALVVMFGLCSAVILVLAYGMQSRRQHQVEQEAERARNTAIEPASSEGVIQPSEPPRKMIEPTQHQQDPVNPDPQLPYAVYQNPAPTPPPPPVKKEPTPEEIAAARVREAMLSPMVIKHDTSQTATATAPLPAIVQHSPTAAPGDPGTPPAMDEYAQVNLQHGKEKFLATARAKASANYLAYTRTRQLAPCEIKAGWEIPAVLEQDINSDLPGEIKALVNQNVYDTATGKYLLIPQGSRLIGKYSSEVGYGQERAQVIWDRIIYPDGSSVNLAGMVGLDSQGNAGFHEKVDRHYKRTFGMAFLTSAFVAAYELTNRRQYGGANGYYGQPSASDRATGAFSGEMMNTASAITRKNMNVQPTIKIIAGYRFTVRVNRDMLFESPYQPDTPAPEESSEPLRKASR
jgi:type IV secretory pathway VirB10-like protein